MSKQVRMADIAEKLNLSVVSVSKALAGKPGISEENRAKVVALARQMGYTGVRTPTRQSTDIHICVLVADHYFAENAFYTQLYRSLVFDSRSFAFARHEAKALPCPQPDTRPKPADTGRTRIGA